MPFVVPPVAADLETLELDGLHFNDGTLNLREVAFPPPRQRQEWIGAADSEWQALVRNPLHDNREITARIEVTPAGNMDGALQRIAEIVDKLQAASQDPDGIELVWSPAESSLTVTFDVLAGEITDMPVDWENGWLAKAPAITVVMKAKPYWRGEETLTSVTTGAVPLITKEIANLIGDVPAWGRLIVTDNATQARRYVEWGLEGPLTYNAATSLIIDSDDMTTSGFAGTQSTQSGAYDPNASGNNVVSMGLLAPQAMAGFSGAHSGSFRVYGRFYCNTGDPARTKIKLAWRDQDGPQSINREVTPTVGIGWNRLPLGTITVTGAWSGYVIAESLYYTETLKLDYIELVPVTAGWGKARASYSYQPGVVVARDEFTGSTAGNNLNGGTAASGGTWATSGSTTDFQFADDLDDEQIKRSTASDASARFAILGSANFTDTEVAADIYTAGGLGSVGSMGLGVIARWVDSSNYLRATWSVARSGFGGPYTHTLSLVSVVTGSETTLASEALPHSSSPGVVPVNARLQLVVFSTGRVIARALDSSLSTVLASAEAQASSLATGGALDDGKPGIYDIHTSSVTPSRYYDDFSVSTPSAEPIVIYSGQSLTIDHEKTERENSAGTLSGRPQSYRGTRFLVPVGTSRVAVEARRNDVETAVADNVTDSTQIQVGITPRGLVVPRA